MKNQKFIEHLALLKKINDSKNDKNDKNNQFKNLIHNERYLFHRNNDFIFTANFISYHSQTNLLCLYLVINKHNKLFNKFNKTPQFSNYMFCIHASNSNNFFEKIETVNSTMLEEIICPKKNSKFLLISKELIYYILQFL